MTLNAFTWLGGRVAIDVLTTYHGFPYQVRITVGRKCFYSRPVFNYPTAAEARAKLDEAERTPSVYEPSYDEPMVVRSHGHRVANVIDLTVTSQVAAQYASDDLTNYTLERHAMFRTNEFGVTPGEELRIYYEGECRFSGHVQQVVVLKPPFGPPYLEVRADNLRYCLKRGSNDEPCLLARAHQGPCS